VFLARNGKFIELNMARKEKKWREIGGETVEMGNMLLNGNFRNILSGW